MIKNLICYGSKAFDIKDLVLSHLSQIKNNIQSFTDNHIFTSLTLELCDPSSPDCPSDIKKYAGLTYPTLARIQMNTNVYEYSDNKYYSNLLSHEFGHWWANYSGFNDNNNELRKIWDNLRGNKELSIIIPSELVAEDFRILFGSGQAKDFERGTYTQATEIKGLKGLMKIFPCFSEYRKKALSQNKNISIVNTFFNGDNFNYFGVMILEKHNLYFWQQQHYFFDNHAMYKYNYTTQNWEVEKYL